MEARAKFLGHPIHQMLIVFPLGLLATSFFFDVAFLVFGRSELATTSWWMILAGVIGGLAAAVFGLIDWLAIPDDTRAKAIGMWHGAGNVGVVGLFAASWFLRKPSPATPPMVTIVLSAIAVAIALVTGWLGGELVDRLGVGVSDDASLDAPSSLRRRS
ncbi:MAG TPA: DUF2231 domain-containing protein [Thermoanaerobaculia bacterium]|nr:DUF2231 domain-containing protein [Thermoanaerobaculia bacterium]